MLPLKTGDFEYPGGLRPAKAPMAETTETRIASLEIHVSVIRSDVSDIKSELRRVNDRIDDANARLNAIREKVDTVMRSTATTDSFDHYIERFREESAAKRRESHARMDKHVSSIKSAKLWGLVLWSILMAGILVLLIHPIE